MACAAPQVMVTGACACRACVIGEKCVRDRLKSLPGERVYLPLHRSALMCRSCGFAAAVEYHTYSTSFNFVQTVILRLLKMKVLCAC